MWKNVKKIQISVNQILSASYVDKYVSDRGINFLKWLVKLSVDIIRMRLN